ncbi:MAG: hypothetical protein J1F03_06380 [Oscillospiraceae bacterium]|nr:hypothetical protein [Oscillospiraceae bacterium]
MMIHYDIDTTENGYNKIRGDAENIDMLKRVIFNDGNFPDCVGYIKADNLVNAVLCICAVKEFGVYIGISYDSREYLSLFDSECLNEVVDVWGDGLYVSRGLFVPAELAWSGIEDFIANGNLTDKIHWISPKDIPEDGNYIL